MTSTFNTSDGTSYNLKPHAVLLIVAHTLYGDPNESTPQGRARAKALVSAILAAARAGGFRHTDILETLLARNVVTQRVAEMAREACAAAGDAAIGQIFDSLLG